MTLTEYVTLKWTKFSLHITQHFEKILCKNVHMHMHARTRTHRGQNTGARIMYCGNGYARNNRGTVGNGVFCVDMLGLYSEGHQEKFASQD
jgi:hypothetical protein